MADETKPTTISLQSDPRVYMALERTFLAWIRTGLSLMGFGFVVARFGLFLRELALSGRGAQIPAGYSTRFGVGLVFLGVVLTIFATVRYLQTIQELRAGSDLSRPSGLAIAVGIALAVIGAAMCLYLLLQA